MFDKRIIFFILLILALPVGVSGQGVAGEQYTFLDIPVCYGGIDIKVRPDSVGEYTIKSCTLEKTEKGFDYWKCPCQNALIMSIPENQINKFVGSVYYNIGPHTGDFLLDTQLERTIPFNFVFTESPGEIYKREEAKRLSELELEKIVSFILGFIGVIFAITILSVVFYFTLRKTLRRWLKLEDEEKLTIGKIFKKIFARESISRKALGKRGEQYTKNNTVANKPVEKITVDSKIEAEIQALLDDIKK